MMATDLYILAALVALLSVTNSLPEKDNKLNEPFSKTKFNRKKSFGGLNNDFNKASESIKLNQKESSFFRAFPLVESEETDFKQTKNEEKERNLRDKNWNLKKWLQNVLDLVRKLDIENLAGIPNDKEQSNNTSSRVFIDKAKESKEKSEKTKFLEIYPIVYVPEIENKQIAERSKLRSLFSSSSSPTLKKRSSKMEYNFERSFDTDSLENYEEEDPCDYENDETNSGFQTAVINSKTIKHIVTKTTNPANRHESANEKTTKSKQLEQDKNSTPTLKYIQTNDIEPHREATINNVTFEKLPDSSYVTPNSSIISMIPNDNDVEKSLKQYNDSQMTTSNFKPKINSQTHNSDNPPQNMNQINISTNDKVLFPISNFSNQEFVSPSPSDTNKTTLAFDHIEEPSNPNSMNKNRKNDQTLLEPLTETVENVKPSSENPAHHIETPKINNDKHEVSDSTNSFISVQIPSTQSVAKQTEKDNELSSKTVKNMLIQAPKVINDTSKNIIQNVFIEKPVAQKSTESKHILQTNKDIPLTYSLISSEVQSENPSINQSGTIIINFQDMPSEMPTEQSLIDSQNILSGVPDNQLLPEEIALKNTQKNSIKKNEVILQYPIPSLDAIRHSPAEEALNKIPSSNESTSQYLTTLSNNIQNSPVEGILNKIPDDEQNKLQYYVSSLGSIQNSPIESILNKIPSDDLNKLEYLISSPNNIQNLPFEGVINNNPGEEQNKLQYSTPSLDAIQNPSIEEVLDQVQSDDLNKSQYLISSPNNIQNLPFEELSNKTASEDITKVQNLIPFIDDIQSTPIEEEINRLKPSLDKSQNLNTSISEFIPENNIKMNDQKNVFPTTQQNPTFESNVDQIPIKQDSTPILHFNQNIPVQYDSFKNDQESDLKPNNKGSDDKLSPLDNKDKILEDSKHMLHFTTPYPIVIQNSSNHLLTEQPEVDDQNMSLPINDISSENTQSLTVSKQLPKNSEPQQSSWSQKPIQNLPIEKSFSTLNEKAPDTLSLSLPETSDDTDLEEENNQEKLPMPETPNEEHFINFSEIDSTENEDYEYLEEEIEDDSSDDDEDSYSSENDYDGAEEELVSSFPKIKEDISSKNASEQYSSSTVPTEIKKQADEKEAEISYDTFLQFLYRHSNSPFIQSLRENSTLS